MVVDVWCGDSDTGRQQHNNELWVEEQNASARERHKDRPTDGRATNGVDELCLDDSAQRKRVRIHDGPRGNKVDGLFRLDDLNKATSRTAGRGLKTKQRDNKQDKQRSETNEARHTRLLGA